MELRHCAKVYSLIMGMNHEDENKDEREKSSYVPDTMARVMTREELMKAYKLRQSINPYDQNAKKVGYNGPWYCAKYLADTIPETERSKTRILDVGAGTGLVAERLIEFGFTDIDALDPSEDMLKEAKRKNVYKLYHQFFLTGEPCYIATDSYDAVISSGCLNENHLEKDVFNEMIRLVKPGGYVILANRTSALETVPAHKGHLEQYMDELEVDEKWIKVKRDTVPNIFLDLDGIVWLYRVL